MSMPLRIFSDLKISAKVGGGFAVVLLITALVGLAGIVAVSQLNTKIDDAVQTTDTLTSLQKFAAARETYLSRKQAENESHVIEALAALTLKLEAVLESVGGTDSEKDVVETIQTVERMKRAFELVTASVATEVSALSELEERSNRLKSSANTVEGQLQKILGNYNESMQANTQERAKSLHNATEFGALAETLSEIRSETLAFALGDTAAAARVSENLQAISQALTDAAEAIRSKRKRKVFTSKMDVFTNLTAHLDRLKKAPNSAERAMLAQELDKDMAAAVAAMTVLAHNANKIFLNTYDVYQQTESKVAHYEGLQSHVGAFSKQLADVEAYTLQALVNRNPDALSEVQRKTIALLETTDTLAERTRDEAQVSSTTGSLAGFVKQYNESFQSIVAAIESQGTALRNLSDLSDLASEQVSAVARAEAVSARSTGQRAILLIGLALACAIAVATAIAVFLSVAISRPVVALTQVMTDLASGHLDVELGGTHRKDEIGDMSRAVQVFQTNAIERNQLEEDQRIAEIRRADRHERVDTLISEFRTGVAGMLETVHVNMDRMKNTARNLTEVAENTTDRTRSAQGSASNTSENVQTVASAAEELSSSISEISRQISTTTEIIQEASERADDSNAKVTGLSEAAQRIGDVVSLIQAIAEQTNLLALNATIEAARAGEAGKGFSVVAAEVKELATQTSRATEEISSHINEIQAATRETVDSIETISSIMSNANEHTASIAAAVDQQGAATGEINVSIQNASNGTQDVSSMMLSLVENMDHTKQESLEVRKTSESVVESNEDLRGLIDTFLTKVSAA